MSAEPPRLSPVLPDSVRQRIDEGAFVLVDKPRGPSSHQVAAWVRDLLGVSRAGHAGTLDPNVSGVLWVGLGPALRLVPLVLEFPKRYIGALVFHATPPRNSLQQVVKEFTGPIYQVPPVRSAVRRERRVRTIYRLEVVEVDRNVALFDVVCDSGTYIRTLAVDLGEALGVGAHLEELRRTGTGPFAEAELVTLSQLADAAVAAKDGAAAELLALLHPSTEVWKEYPQLVLKDGAAAAVAHGADLARNGVVSMTRPFREGASVVLVDRHEHLVAVGTALRASEDWGKAGHGWVVDARSVFADPRQYPAQWRRGRAEKAKADDDSAGP